MKVIVAMDSFKGSATSTEVGNAVKEGIEQACKKKDTVHVKVLPIADGGEGTIDALFGDHTSSIHSEIVNGLFRNQRVTARYGILHHTVVLEVAETSGITLVPKKDLDPWHATSYGLGELMKKNIEAGHRSFLIGLGGSGTNDGGIGFLAALGVKFFDIDGKDLGYYVKDMKSLNYIDTSLVNPELKNCFVKIASDVKNPLNGENGATYIFGNQKGVKGEEREEIDAILKNFARVTNETTGKKCQDEEGAGAAGGLGFAIMSYLESEVVSGFEEITKLTKLEEYIEQSDFVITGEGMLDAQSMMGKVPVAIAQLAKTYNKPVIAIAGSVSEDAYQCNALGIDAFFPTIRKIASEKEILDKSNTLNAVTETAQQLFQFAQLCKNNDEKDE